MFSSHYRISDELISQPSWCMLGSDAISWAASCKYGETYRPVLEETDHKKITQKLISNICISLFCVPSWCLPSWGLIYMAITIKRMWAESTTPLVWPSLIKLSVEMSRAVTELQDTSAACEIERGQKSTGVLRKAPQRRIFQNLTCSKNTPQECFWEPSLTKH